MKFSTNTDVSKFDPEQQDALLAEIQAEALRILKGEGMPECWLGNAQPPPDPATLDQMGKIKAQRRAAAIVANRPDRDASFAAGATMFARAAQARQSLRDAIETRRATAPPSRQP